MSLMKLVCLLYIIIIATACHKKEATSSADGATNVGATTPNVESGDNPVSTQKPKQVPPPLFSKVFRESLYFAKSLEREALKLLVRDNPQQSETLFSILSYAVESYAGSKKSAPFGLDCTRFEFKKTGSLISVLKTCTKPPVEVATINVQSEDRDYNIKFNINEWARIVGPSAALTGSDVKCQLRIVSEKLNVLKCENWAMQTNQEQLSATVIKTDEFVFQRNAEKQFVIRGGFYKELIKNKKIDIEVPLDGKIKIIEKEIKVIDEFESQKNGVIDNGQQKENDPTQKSNQGIEFKKLEQRENQGQSESQGQGESQGTGQSPSQEPTDQNKDPSQNQEPSSGQEEQPKTESSSEENQQPQNRRGRGQTEPTQNPTNPEQPTPVEGGGRGR